MHNKKSLKGFTVVELAIVIIIAGVMMVAYITTYDTYRKRISLQRTMDTLDRMENALADFYGIYGRYPCPANRRLSSMDQMYGHEIYMTVANLNAVGSSNCSVPCETTGASNADELQIAGVPIGVICVNEGSRDVMLDGTDDWVMIGTVPVATLFRDVSSDPEMRLEGDTRFDGQDMQITYAITEEMTDNGLSLNNPANPNAGAISVRDENGRQLTDPDNSAHYVLISHGINSRGAFSEVGTQVGDCLVGSGVPAPAPLGFNPGSPGIATEIENCDDNDAIFVKGLYSLSDGDDYFDDFVTYRARATTALWRRSNSAPTGTVYLYNTNLGRVGVNNDTPTFILDVFGNIRVEDQVGADDNICDSLAVLPTNATDPECIRPDFLAGDMSNATNSCPSGEVAVEIEKNRILCEPILDGVVPSVAAGSGTCDATARAIGFDIDINTGEFTLICVFP